MRGIRSRLRISILSLLTSGLTAMGQPSVTNLVTFLTTNRFPDGSTIQVEALSYGVIHQIVPQPEQEPRYLKSTSPTIMFTITRHAFYGRSLGDTDDLFTKAEAPDSSGNWNPLHAYRSNYYEGFVPITEFSETWDFPHCPEPGVPIHVRIWATRNDARSASVEFTLPNDAAWREQSIKEQKIALRYPLGDELFSAALSGDIAHVKELIALGADPDSCNSAGMSALASACQQGYSDVVSYLLDHGADVNFHSKDKPIDRTALMVACSYDKHSSIIRMLVERGADVNIQGELGWTALIWAANAGEIETVKFLLSKGADPSIKDNYAKSAIELTEKTQNANRVEIIKILKSAQRVN